MALLNPGVLLCFCFLIGRALYCTTAWVGPVWGFDADQDDIFGDDIVKRMGPDGITRSPYQGLGTLLYKRVRDDRIAKFYCLPEKAKSCEMGGRGPNIYKRLSAGVAVCICFCPSGYVNNKCMDS